jgi:RNase P subunit RPR2
MKKKISKIEAQEQIEEFCSKIQEKTPKEIKKIKRLAMAHNIKLGEKRKTFCKACYNPYIGPSIRIKNDLIRIECEHCEKIARWKVK